MRGFVFDCRYEDAVATFQKMVDVRPDQTSYARVSYARELHGDLKGAMTAMQAAVNAAPPGTEGTEWTRVQLGQLYFNTGDPTTADQLYQQSLALYPANSIFVEGYLTTPGQVATEAHQMIAEMGFEIEVGA